MGLISSIKKFQGAGDRKVLVENFVSLTLLQICTYVFPLLTFPYLSRVLGVSVFGAISFASAMGIYFLTIVDWGFNLISAREVAKNRDDSAKVNHILTLTIFAKMILMAFTAIVLLVLTLTVDIFKDKTALLWLTFLMVPGHLFFPEWFFQGLERMKYITLLNFLVKLIFTSLIFILVKSPSDYLWQPALQAIGFAVAGCLAMWLIIRKWGYRLVKVSFRECLKFIKDGFDVFLNILMPNLYNSVAVLLVGFWGGDYANGLLEGGAKLVTVSINFLMVITRVFYPFLARRMDKHNLFVTISLTSSLLVSVLMFIFAPWIIHILLDSAYDGSILVLRILAASAFFVTLANTYGSNYLILKNQEALARNITVWVSLVAFGVSLWLISEWSWIGAAISMMFGRMLLGTGTWIGALYIKRKEKLVNRMTM